MLMQVIHECDPQYLDGAEYRSGPTPEEIIATTVPSWFVGLGVQVLDEVSRAQVQVHPVLGGHLHVGVQVPQSPGDLPDEGLVA